MCFCVWKPPSFNSMFLTFTHYHFQWHYPAWASCWHLTQRGNCLLTVLLATSEAVGFFAEAQPVDKGTQLPHVLHPPCHHHVLLDDVGLRKVSPSLSRRHTNGWVTQTIRGLGTGCSSQSALPDNGFGNGDSQVGGWLTLTLMSSSHRFLGGITIVVFSSVM